MDSVIGIDLSGLSRGTKGQTALAEISTDRPARLLSAHSFRRGERHADEALTTWVTDRHPRCVAIDAPLSLPHSVTCTVAACPRCNPVAPSYLARDVDRTVGGMPTAMLAAITFRGMWLAKVLREHDIDVIETYPAGVLADFGLGRIERRDSTAVDRVLSDRVAGYRADTMDARHAVCAALAARDFTTGTGSEIAGLDGSIWLTARDQDALAVDGT